MPERPNFKPPQEWREGKGKLSDPDARATHLGFTYLGNGLVIHPEGGIARERPGHLLLLPEDDWPAHEAGERALRLIQGSKPIPEDVSDQEAASG